MARPLKRTVDYFPHFVQGGKTLMILQNEFGNDGYAFWYQLLSLLCKTEEQVYDYNNPASWRLLLAETHVNEDIANKILQILADINAIDSGLYKGKVIWVQNLVDNLGEVYTRRRNGSTPEKPVIVDNNPVNDSKKPQTIPDHTKPDHTKQRKESYCLPEYINDDIWNAYLEMRKKKRATPTDKAIELILKDLAKFMEMGQDPNKVLEMSIKNNWTDVYPLKDKGRSDGKAGRYNEKTGSLRDSINRPIK